MKIQIEGNPGTGNTFQETNIGYIENNFPALKEMTIIKTADGQKITTKTGEELSALSSVANTPDDKEGKRADILKYVEKTIPFVRYQWKDSYMELWNDILDIPEVDALVYNKKRQKRTSFNRRALCHIIFYVGSQVLNGIGLFEKYNATHISLAFGDGAEKSTRPELGFLPEIEIRKAIDKLLESKKYAVKTSK